MGPESETGSRSPSHSYLVHGRPPMTHKGRPGAYPSGRWDELPGFRFRSSPVQIQIRFRQVLSIQLFNECSKMRRDGSRQSVVPVLQESPNYHEGNSPVASGIDVALRAPRSNIPTYPVIDPISREGG